MRQDYIDLRRTIAEFPLTAEAVEESSRRGDMIKVDRPNVVHGGSYLGLNCTSVPKECAEGRGGH